MKKKVLIIIVVMILIGLYTIINIGIASSDIKIEINKKNITQGGVISLRISGKKLNNIKVFFNNRQIKKYLVDNRLECLIPVSYWTEPGNYVLQLKRNNTVLDNKNIKVISGNFNTSYIQVSKEKEQILKPQNNDLIQQKEKEKKLLSQAIAESSQNKLWQDKFIWPVKGTITTDFGATRYVNNKLQSRHSGIDISAPAGTPVKAANRGYVKLATNLLVTGNTIIIDHGRNIFSSYSHLDSINIKPGELVDRGQIIGTLGNSGFSTGAHLHWVIKINNIYINPREFID